MWFLALLAISDSTTVRLIPVAPGESIAVSITGHGDPVVLLPGLFGSAFGFRRVTPLMVNAGYQVLTVEPLGLGGSSRPRDADYSLTAQAERVAAVLDTLALENAIIVGHSISGSIAMRLAVMRPDLVAGLISIEGGPAEEATTPGFRRSMVFAPLLKLFGGKGLVRNEVRRRLVSASADPSWVTEDILDGYTADATRDVGATLDAFKGMAKSSEPWLLAEVLGEIRSPMRLLLGMAPHSAEVPREQVELLRNSVATFAIDKVADVGHFIFEERPEAVMATLLLLQVDRAKTALFPVGS